MSLAVFKMPVMIRDLNILSWSSTSVMKMTSSSSNSQTYMRNEMNELRNIQEINCFWEVLKLNSLWKDIMNFFFIFFEVRLWVSFFLMIEIKQSIKTDKLIIDVIMSQQTNIIIQKELILQRMFHNMKMFHRNCLIICCYHCQKYDHIERIC